MPREKPGGCFGAGHRPELWVCQSKAQPPGALTYVVPRPGKPFAKPGRAPLGLRFHLDPGLGTGLEVEGTVCAGWRGGSGDAGLEHGTVRRLLLSQASACGPGLGLAFKGEGRCGDGDRCIGPPGTPKLPCRLRGPRAGTLRAFDFWLNSPGLWSPPGLCREPMHARCPAGPPLLSPPPAVDKIGFQQGPGAAAMETWFCLPSWGEERQGGAACVGGCRQTGPAEECRPLAMSEGPASPCSVSGNPPQKLPRPPCKGV